MRIVECALILQLVTVFNDIKDIPFKYQGLFLLIQNIIIPIHY